MDDMDELLFGMNFLHNCYTNNIVLVAATLIIQPSLVDYQSMGDTNSAIILAAKINSMELVKLIIKFKCNINARTHKTHSNFMVLSLVLVYSSID